MHVKKGDTVLVLSGNDKGRTGEVKQAMPRESKVVVAGVNLRWRHNRPSQKNPKGERVQRELPIHASNVRRVEASAGKGAKGSKAAKSKGGEGERKKGERTKGERTKDKGN